VICGREKAAHNHAGNRRFRQLIQDHRASYQDATKRIEKSSITQKIVSAVSAVGGRFVRFEQDQSLWVELSDAEAHEKVSHALRSAKQIPKVTRKPKRKSKRVSKGNERMIDEGMFARIFARQQELLLDDDSEDEEDCPNSEPALDVPDLIYFVSQGTAVSEISLDDGLSNSCAGGEPLSVQECEMPSLAYTTSQVRILSELFQV